MGTGSYCKYTEYACMKKKGLDTHFEAKSGLTNSGRSSNEMSR